MMLLLVLLQEIEQKFQWFRTGFFKAILKTQIFKWLNRKLTFFSTNVYSDSGFAFFSLRLHSRLSQLEKYILCSWNRKNNADCSKTSSVLISKLILMGFPILKVSCEWESCRIHSWIKFLIKLIIAVGGFIITVASVSSSLNYTYQKNHCDKVNAVSNKNFCRLFFRIVLEWLTYCYWIDQQAQSIPNSIRLYRVPFSFMWCCLRIN